MLLAANAVSAQSLAVNKTDAATGSKIIITKNHKGKEIAVDDSVAKSGLVFFSAGYQNTASNGNTIATYFIDLDMFHNNNKLGCIQQSAENVTLILEDGTEIHCCQISDTECSNEAFKAAFALMSKNESAEQMEQNFKKLQATGINRIKVKTSESSLDYKIGSKSSDYIKKHFGLIAKTLSPTK